MVFCIQLSGGINRRDSINQFFSSPSLKEDLHFQTFNNINGLVILIKFFIGTFLPTLINVPLVSIQRLPQ